MYCHFHSIQGLRGINAEALRDQWLQLLDWPEDISRQKKLDWTNG
jgi:hypothetical protein